jgi:hypothetical protein
VPWRIQKGRAYFYRSVREGGRVRSVYCGGGLLGAAEALLADERRAEAEAWRAERRLLEDEERSAVDLFDRVEWVARAALAASGYHRHNRGPWRQRRMRKPNPQPRSKATPEAEAGVPAAAGQPVPPPAPGGRKPLTRAEAQALVDRLSEGDQSALPEFRRYLAREGAALLDELGSVRELAEEAVIDAFTAGDMAVREAVRARVAALRRELAGESPTPLERLLVERVAFCWLTTYRLERSAARYGESTFAQAEFLERRLERASRRFLAACRTLATVRRLALPAIQFNVAERQVNVAGPG